MARVLRAEWALAGALWLGLPAAFCASGCAPGGVTGSAGTAHAAAVPAVRFEDVTTERGIDFRLDHPDPARMTIVQISTGGAGLLDYDGDGDLDALLVGLQKCALFRNDGTGHFEDVSREAGLTS